MWVVPGSPVLPADSFEHEIEPGLAAYKPNALTPVLVTRAGTFFFV